MLPDNPIPVTGQVQAGTTPTTPSAQPNDPLAKATASIEMILSQTVTNPSARASQIAATKAVYLAEKFGVR